jgi:hypothetical protein
MARNGAVASAPAFDHEMWATSPVYSLRFAAGNPWRQLKVTTWADANRRAATGPDRKLVAVFGGIRAWPAMA